MPELGYHQLGRVGVNGLIDRCHYTHAHQRLDHIGAALGHAVCHLLDCNCLRDNDVAYDFDLLQFTLVLPLSLALPRAANRSQATHSLPFVISERAGHRDFSGPAARLVATSRRGRFFGLRPCPPPRRRRGLLLLFEGDADLARRGERSNFRGSRLPRPLGDLPPRLFVSASLRLLFGSLARFLFGAPAPLLLLGLFTCFVLSAAACLFCGLFFFLAAPVGFGDRGTSACFFIGFAGIVHRADTPRLFFCG